MKRILLIVAVIIMVIVAMPVAFKYSEQPYTYYDSYSKNIHNGLWVPDIFPTDMVEIHEQHDIDTNQVWLKFTTGKQKINLQQFTIIERSKIKFLKPFLTTWWLNELPSHYSIYQGLCVNNKKSQIAISTESKVVYWWC